MVRRGCSTYSISLHLQQKLKIGKIERMKSELKSSVGDREIVSTVGIMLKTECLKAEDMLVDHFSQHNLNILHNDMRVKMRKFCESSRVSTLTTKMQLKILFSLLEEQLRSLELARSDASMKEI